MNMIPQNYPLWLVATDIALADGKGKAPARVIGPNRIIGWSVDGANVSPITVELGVLELSGTDRNVARTPWGLLKFDVHAREALAERAAGGVHAVVHNYLGSAS